jgi:hypothetical protein
MQLLRSSIHTSLARCCPIIRCSNHRKIEEDGGRFGSLLFGEEPAAAEYRDVTAVFGINIVVSGWP